MEEIVNTRDVFGKHMEVIYFSCIVSWPAWSTQCQQHNFQSSHQTGFTFPSGFRNKDNELSHRKTLENCEYIVLYMILDCLLVSCVHVCVSCYSTFFSFFFSYTHFLESSYIARPATCLNLQAPGQGNEKVYCDCPDELVTPVIKFTLGSFKNKWQQKTKLHSYIKMKIGKIEIKVNNKTLVCVVQK